MAFTRLEKDMAVIAALDNEPNDVGGLTAAELKSKFDEAGEAIKLYLTDVLLKELESPRGAESLGAMLVGEATTVQLALEKLRQELLGVSMGAVPAKSVTTEKLSDAAVGTEQLQSGAVTAEKLSAGAVTAEAMGGSARALFAPAFTAGTEDLEPGVTPLASGTLHFVYE